VAQGGNHVELVEGVVASDPEVGATKKGTLGRNSNILRKKICYLSRARF